MKYKKAPIKHTTFNRIFDPWQRNEPLIEQFDPSTLCIHTSCSQIVKKKTILSQRLKNYPQAQKQLSWFVKNIPLLCTYLQKHDIPEFINALDTKSFCTKQLNNEDQSSRIETIINKYKSFAHLLVCCQSRKVQEGFLLWLAQSLFTTVFDTNYASTFIKKLNEPDFHPIARMIFTTIWCNLGPKNWASWHTSTLYLLKQSSQPISYLAGGTDIFVLLQSGIYDIHIIDPFLPTQHLYYSKGWRFLIGGRQQDQLLDTCTNYSLCPPLFIKRAHFKHHGSFKLTNKFGRAETIPKSTTNWHLFQHRTKPEGIISFNRRPVNWKDLWQNKQLLVSFNELYFIASQEHGWGIPSNKLPESKNIYVKQFSHPISIQAIKNLQKADLTSFQFIQLGSCVN